MVNGKEDKATIYLLTFKLIIIYFDLVNFLNNHMFDGSD